MNKKTFNNTYAFVLIILGMMGIINGVDADIPICTFVGGLIALFGALWLYITKKTVNNT